MSLFALIGRDAPGGSELRRQHRPAHLANLQTLVRSGSVRYAGPLLDEAGAPCGSLVVFEADDLAAARRFAAGDPYVTGGVFASHEVVATRQVFPEEK